MSRRSYDQLCPIALALDLVGERWTLLVVRELMAGPKRYTDLRAGLPGIATDLLTKRLRDLEAAGLVRRRDLPPPAASTVYELSERGRGLEPALYHLGRFGLELLPDSLPGDAELPLDRVALALRLLFEPERTRGVHERFRLELDGRAVTIAVEDGAMEVDPSPAGTDADVTISADAATLFEIGSGSLDPADAVAHGRVRVEGEAGLERFLAFFPPRGSAEMEPV
jgi:DNA-binding HxlR family transcriptional regulator